MTFPGQHSEPDSGPCVAVDELCRAHDDLVRLSTLLGHAFDELLNSFRVVQLVADNGGDVAEIERAANRAITALQCGALAGELIASAQQRLTRARLTLQNDSQMPQIVSSDMARVDGVAIRNDSTRARQASGDGTSAGIIDLF